MSDADMPHGTCVHLVTVVVHKRRCRRLGLQMQRGVGHPTVTHSDCPSLRGGDVLYVINGRPAVGARRVAWRIWWARDMSVTVWRADARADSAPP